MSKWEMVKVGEVFSLIRNGASIKQGIIPGGYPITRIETIANSEVDRNRMGYAGITDIAKYDNYVLQTGDILMSHINSEKHLGKTAYYEKEQDEIVIHGMNLLCLRPIKAVIDYKYAYYFFQSNVFKHQIPNITKKSVNQASFTVSALKKLTLPLPSIKNQQQIAKTLDTAAELLTMRKQQLTELDNLIKSIFYEMFGDPNSNEKGWKKKFWNELFNTTTGKLDANAMSEEGIYPFFTCSKEVYRINDYAFDCEALLLAGNNATANYDVKYYNGKFNAYQRTYVITLKNMHNKYSIFKYLIENKLKNLQNSSKGTNTKYLTLGILARLSFIIPPVTLQVRFNEIVTKIEEQKALVQKAIDKTQYLFDSLMSEYFE